MNEVATHRRWMLAFLLAPALLWLGGLVVLPHIELAMLSLQARVGPGEYAASLNQYRTHRPLIHRFDDITQLTQHGFVISALKITQVQH